jgi:hypothetical protein
MILLYHDDPQILLSSRGRRSDACGSRDIAGQVSPAETCGDGQQGRFALIRPLFFTRAQPRHSSSGCGSRIRCGELVVPAVGDEWGCLGKSGALGNLVKSTPHTPDAAPISCSGIFTTARLRDHKSCRGASGRRCALLEPKYDRNRVFGRGGRAAQG